jgi:hypothetical protein|tara:strand:+ start:10 stop:180 length:171 start_codon:yes stop_codon:yes gene_type:complete
MLINTKEWVDCLVIRYNKGKPTLLQDILNEQERNKLANLIDGLTIIRIDEALSNED